MEEDIKEYVFCEIGKDYMERYMKECEELKSWFVELDKDAERCKRIWNDNIDEIKTRILWKI